MAIKLFAIYNKPEDEAAFNEYFENKHMPLVHKVPGLQACTVNRITKHLRGDDQLYMIVEMSYPDRETFDKAMNSEENRAAGKDLREFAQGLFTLVFAEG